jgi:hypothetical protein
LRSAGVRDASRTTATSEDPTRSARDLLIDCVNYQDGPPSLLEPLEGALEDPRPTRPYFHPYNGVAHDGRSGLGRGVHVRGNQVH